MKNFERVKLIIIETLGSPLTDSCVAKPEGKNVIVLKKQGNYQGLDLSNLDLEGSHIEGANLRNAILRNTNLSGAYLNGANMEGADLTNTTLAGVDLSNVKVDVDALKVARIDVKPIRIAMNVPATFKLVFIGALSLTILSFIGLAYLAVFSAANQIPIPQQTLLSACNFGWRTGVGAIFGLLCGKAIE